MGLLDILLAPIIIPLGLIAGAFSKDQRCAKHPHNDQWNRHHETGDDSQYDTYTCAICDEERETASRVEGERAERERQHRYAVCRHSFGSGGLYAFCVNCGMAAPHAECSASHCGKRLPPGTSYCSSCGSKCV